MRWMVNFLMMVLLELVGVYIKIEYLFLSDSHVLIWNGLSGNGYCLVNFCKVGCFVCCWVVAYCLLGDVMFLV